MAIKVLVTHTLVIEPAIIALGNRLLDTTDKILAALEPQAEIDTTALQAKLDEAEKRAADWERRAAEAGIAETPTPGA